jgi:hypothetical protein
MPTGLRVTEVGETRFTLHWNAVAGAARYVLYLDGERLFSVGGTSFPFELPGSCGTPWTVGVQAEDQQGRPSAVAELNVTTAACPPTPPGAPSGITFTNVQTDRFDVAWNGVPGAVSYVLYLNGMRLLSWASTKFANFVVGGPCGTTWRVGVQAQRGDGALSAITERSVTTAQCPPPPPAEPLDGLRFQIAFGDNAYTLVDDYLSCPRGALSVGGVGGTFSLVSTAPSGAGWSVFATEAAGQQYGVAFVRDGEIIGIGGVLAIRSPGGEVGSLGLDGPGCPGAAPTAIGAGAPFPLRVSVGGPFAPLSACGSGTYSRPAPTSFVLTVTVAACG